MDPKVSPQFWTDRDVIELDAGAKLAAFWMITNSSVNLAGYADVSMKVFRFETDGDAEAMARACDGLSRNFIRTERGYWMRNFIRYQLGAGESLTRNKMCGPLIRDMRTMPPAVVALVLEQYPELRSMWDKAVCDGQGTSPSMPSASPAHAHGMDQSRAEQSRVEQSRAEQSGAQGGAGGTAPTLAAPSPASPTPTPSPTPAPAPAPTAKRTRAPKPGYSLPSTFGEPFASRLISIGLLKGRQASTPWAPTEIEAVRAACLDTLSDEDFEAQMRPMRKYYLAAIPREKDFRRTALDTLLNHWSGELDRARAYARDNDDGIKRY